MSAPIAAPLPASKVSVANRVATALAVLAGIATAAIPAIIDADWETTAGVIAGGLSVVGAIVYWLKGWQSYERDERLLTGLPQGTPALDPTLARQREP
jgi:hypothetical protein